MTAAESDNAVFHICFVCTGNICRSPMAETICREMAERQGLAEAIAFTSAGIGDWHVGEKADPRTLAALARAGYCAENHRAKQFEASWFDSYDLVVTFDPSQERVLKTWAGTPERIAVIRPLLSFSDHHTDWDVPDPYYGNDELFNEVRDLIEESCGQLLAQIEPAVRAARDTANR